MYECSARHFHSIVITREKIFICGNSSFNWLPLIIISSRLFVKECMYIYGRQVNQQQNHNNNNNNNNNNKQLKMKIQGKKNCVLSYHIFSLNWYSSVEWSNNYRTCAGRVASRLLISIKIWKKKCLLCKKQRRKYIVWW
jgi:hypothetical protein